MPKKELKKENTQQKNKVVSLDTASLNIEDLRHDEAEIERVIKESEKKEGTTMNKLKNLFKTSYVLTFLAVFGTIFLTEVIFRIIAHLSIFSYQMIRIGLYDLIFATLISLLISRTPTLVRKIIYGIISFGVSAYACIQLGFNEFIGVYASLNTSSQLGAVTDYISDFLKSFNILYLLTFIPFLLVIAYIIFVDRKSHKPSWLAISMTSLILFLLTIPPYCIFVTSTKFQNKFQTISNKDLFRTAANPSLAIDNFGVFGFLFLDVKSVIHPVELDNNFVINTPDVQEVTDYTRHIDDTLWTQIAAETTNSTYKSLNEYYMNQNITPKNEYTGMFEGKNLVVILMESAGDLMINPEYFPNFYKLYNEGWTWENNYSPRNSCATMNNEFSGLTSLYSISNNCTASVYKNNKYQESIFGLFNKAGYKTFSAHDYPDDYYPRNTIHPNMGSMAFYDAPKLKMNYQHEYINWADDEEFFQKILELIDTNNYADGKFMTWLTTVSGHQPYTVSCITCDKYYSITEGSGLNSNLRRYYSKLKILDTAIGILMQGLQDRGLLDDTVFVLYGDHYPYGMSTKLFADQFDYDVTVDNSVEQVPFVIYNTGITNPQKRMEYTSYINILPTVANLFNLDYDPRLYMGTDLFSETYESRVVFADGTWKNEHAFYNAKTNKIKYYEEGFTYTDEEISAINNKISTMINVSAKSITSNYFNFLSTELDKKKAEIKAAEEAKQQALLESQNVDSNNQVVETN